MAARLTGLATTAEPAAQPLAEPVAQPLSTAIPACLVAGPPVTGGYRGTGGQDAATVLDDE